MAIWMDVDFDNMLRLEASSFSSFCCFVSLQFHARVDTTIIQVERYLEFNCDNFHFVLVEFGGLIVI